MNFDALKLPHGASLQVQVINSAGQTEQYSSRFVGVLSETSLILTLPRAAGKFARFRPGQRLAVRMIVANGVGLFATVVEAQINEPFPLLFVSYPESVTFKGIRKATRVAVNLPVSVDNISSLHGASCAGHMVDVSVSGARLELKEALAGIGDEVIVKARVPVGELEFDWAIKSVIRSRIKRSTQEQVQEFPAVYGIEFIEKNPEALLILYGYVYSQIVADQTPSDNG